MRMFSHRKGIKPISEVIQLQGMDTPLRNSLWNVLHQQLWSSHLIMMSSLSGYNAPIESFTVHLWTDYFKWAKDTAPHLPDDMLAFIREYFFKCEWNEVYDFLEVTISFFKSEPQLPAELNFVLERELSGYRIVGGQVVDITDTQELEMLQGALTDTVFGPVSRHLQRALELYADRKAPDYRNSIKESISAVESLARIISGKPSAALTDALSVLEASGKLHPALRSAFSKLYGYTSDADGIRHAMLDQPSVTAADAKFFLMSCTSFVNYLKANMT